MNTSAKSVITTALFAIGLVPFVASGAVGVREGALVETIPVLVVKVRDAGTLKLGLSSAHDSYAVEEADGWTSIRATGPDGTVTSARFLGAAESVEIGSDVAVYLPSADPAAVVEGAVVAPIVADDGEGGLDAVDTGWQCTDSNKFCARSTSSDTWRFKHWMFVDRNADTNSYFRHACEAGIGNCPGPQLANYDHRNGWPSYVIDVCRAYSAGSGGRELWSRVTKSYGGLGVNSNHISIYNGNWVCP